MDNDNNLNSYENAQYKLTEEKIDLLEEILNQGSKLSDTSNDYSLNTDNKDDNQTEYLFDPMEDTRDINSIQMEIESLRLAREEAQKIAEDNNTLDDSNNSQSKGKQKVLSTNPNIKYDDVREITSSFISCFVLAFVTASIGTGWLLNLINLIR